VGWVGSRDGLDVLVGIGEMKEEEMPANVRLYFLRDLRPLERSSNLQGY